MKLEEKICQPFDGLKKETLKEVIKIIDDFSIEFVEWFLLYENIKFDDKMNLEEVLELYKKTL